MGIIYRMGFDFLQNEKSTKKPLLRGGPWSGWELKPLSVRNTETLDKFGKSLRESSEDSIDGALLDLRKKNEEKNVSGFAKPSTTVKWGVSSFNNATNQFKKVSSQNSNANVNPVSAMTTNTVKNAMPVIGMFDFTKYGSNSALGKMSV
jgi:hypothetical protein